MEKFIHNIAMEVEIQRQPTKMKELPYLTSEYNYERINFAKNRMQDCRKFGSGEKGRIRCLIHNLDYEVFSSGSRPAKKSS